jgi:hypothetical protein
MEHDEEIVRRVIQKELEIFLKAHHWPDQAVMEVLIEMARDRLWKRGFMLRFRYWANIVGMLGIFGTAITMIIYLLGFEVIRK